MWPGRGKKVPLRQKLMRVFRASAAPVKDTAGAQPQVCNRE